jgi:hypothetical protein
VTENGEPAGAVIVVLVPRRRDRRELYRATRTDDEGRFSIRGIAPGGYQLFAWAEPPEGAWMDPEFLKPFETAAVPIDIKEKSRETVQLKLLPNP